MSDADPSRLRRFAREQRSNAVQAEAVLWRAVRDRRCNGAKFRRQVVIGNYIVDFVCFERRLVVEIDGPTHESVEQREKDLKRDAWLREQDFRILRLPNELVIGTIELAVDRISAALIGPLTTTGRPSAADNCCSTAARCCDQSMKYGPTSAAVSTATRTRATRVKRTRKA